MKKLKNIIGTSASLLMFGLLTGCSSDLDVNSPDIPTQPTETEYFLQLNINFDSSTRSRSETDQNGNTSSVPAIANENKIESVHLYFFDAAANGTLLCEFSSTSSKALEIEEAKVPNETKYTLTQKVDAADLKKIFKKTVNIYALANLSNYPNLTSSTTEANFLNEKLTGDAASSLVQPFMTTEPTTTYGKVCPMGNISKFTINLTGVGDNLGDNPSDGEVLTAFANLFDGTYKDEEGKDLGKLWKIVDNLDYDKIEVERMVARIDYLDGSSGENNIYRMPDSKCDNTDCYDGSGTILKVNNISIKHIGNQEYLFRHTASGNNSAASTNTVAPFGVENGEVANVYNWVADSDWGSTKSFLSSVTAKADDITKIKAPNYLNDYYAPWYYIPENTVASTSDMSMANCTYLEFEVVLCTKSNTVYISNTDEKIKITYTTGTNKDKYQVMTWHPTNHYYYLTYNYLIPHNIGNKYQVDGNNGTTGDASTLDPMQYGIVRNNVYQLKLYGINRLPDAKSPLTLQVRVKPWEYEAYETEW